MKFRKFFIVSFLLFVSFFSAKSQDATALYNEGLQLKKEKKIGDALQKFKQASALKENYAEAMYEMGWCYNELKQYTNAIAAFRKVKPLWPDVSKVYFETGYAFDKSDNKDSALANYLKCLKLNPSYSLAYKQLGYFYYDKEDYTTAIEYCEKYENHATSEIGDYLYWYRKGFMYNALKNYPEAKAALLKSELIKTDYVNTYLELGFACSKQKQNEDAIMYYKKAMDLDPKSHIPYNGIGEVYRDNEKNMQEAIYWYQKTLAINPTERKANFGMGYCLNNTGKYVEAVKYLETAINSEPTYTAAYVELGYSNYMLSSFDEGLKHLRKAISLNPKNENARYYAGLIYIEKKDKASAQKMADELRGLSSKNAETLQAKVNAMY